MPAIDNESPLAQDEPDDIESNRLIRIAHVDDRVVLLEDKSTAFIIRVWLEQREFQDAPVAWRASIEHVASGRTKYLTNLDDIAHFIRPHLEAMGVTFVKPAE